MSTLTDELRRLHEAALSAPWTLCGTSIVGESPAEDTIIENLKLTCFFRNHAATIIARLESAEKLAEYSGHRLQCGIRMQYGHPCYCGYEEALAAWNAANAEQADA